MVLSVNPVAQEVGWITYLRKPMPLTSHLDDLTHPPNSEVRSLVIQKPVNDGPRDVSPTPKYPSFQSF